MSIAFAGEIDLLVQKLVEKGVLTPGEAQQIVTETREEVKKEIAQGKSESLPSWVQNIKFKGDFRMRYQWENRDGSNLNVGKTNDRNRERIRLRFGAEAKANDKAKVYLGLATGENGDPRSTNVTLTDLFSKKSIYLDYAYGDYQIANWLWLAAGRMKNPIWEPGDMLWDTDINPEGGAAKFNFNLKDWAPNLEVYANTGIYSLYENSNGSDAFMYVLQPGFKWGVTPDINVNFANSVYGFHKLKGTTVSFSGKSNTPAPNAPAGLSSSQNFYKFNFNSVNPNLEISFNEPFKLLHIEMPSLLKVLEVPYLSLYSEYVNNLDADFSKSGWASGIRFGTAKVANKGDWQARYQYTMLGTNAWPDVFPDSDRYGGRTGIRGHEFEFTYGLGKNLNFNLDYYMTNLTSSDLNTENLLQADLNWKF